MCGAKNAYAYLFTLHTNCMVGYLHLSFIGKNVVAYYDYHYATIRHVDCLYKLPEPNSRCKHCKRFRDNVLRSCLSRLLRKENEENDPTRADSHTNFRALTPCQKDERLRNMRKVIHLKDNQIHILKKTLNSHTNSD